MEGLASFASLSSLLSSPTPPGSGWTNWISGISCPILPQPPPPFQAGTVIGEIPDGEPPLPPHCSDPHSTLGPCTGCFVDGNKPVLAPCDDNTTASVGAQKIALDFDRLPAAWIGLPEHGHGAITCDIYDIFAAKSGGSGLGTFTASWSATVRLVLYTFWGV